MSTDHLTHRHGTTRPEPDPWSVEPELPPDRPTSALHARLLETRATTVAEIESLSEEVASLLPMIVEDPSVEATYLAALRRLAATEQVLSDIDRGITRCLDGTYGWCAGCGEAIPAERLELKPHASYCVTCT